MAQKTAEKEALERLDRLVHSIESFMREKKAGRATQEQTRDLNREMEEFEEGYLDSLPLEAREQYERLAPAVRYTCASQLQKAINGQRKTDKTARSRNGSIGPEWERDDVQIRVDPDKYSKKLERLPWPAVVLNEFLLEKLKEGPKITDTSPVNQLQRRVSLAEFWQRTGKDLFPKADMKTTEEEEERLAKALQNAIKEVRNACSILRATSFTLTGKNVGGRKQGRGQYGILASYFITDTTDPYACALTVEFSIPAAKFFQSRTTIPVPEEAYMLTGYDRVAWALIWKMSEHYYTYQNWPDPDKKRNAKRAKQKQAGTYNVLSLQSLAKAAPLPDEKNCCRHPNAKIRDKLLDGLQKLTREGGVNFMDFEIYEKLSNGSRRYIDLEDAYQTDWEILKHCYVTFCLENEARGHAQRVKEYYDQLAEKQKHKPKKQTKKEKASATDRQKQ